MRTLLVAGARPNFMKVAPVLRALEAAGHETTLVHTGQHYDAAMSDAFFRDLDLRAPDYYLGVGSATHAVQTARVMEAFEPVLLDSRPDWLVVVGDVNSTLACALVAAKLEGETGARIAHVEAGLRSGDWRMPEEVNRVLTDRLSHLLLTPTRDAAPNLLREGIDAARIAFIGNVMIDTLLARLDAARSLDAPAALRLDPGDYAVATLHRPSNVDRAEPLGRILGGLAAVAAEMPVLLPLHPRTAASVQRLGLADALAPLTVTEPLGYLDMLSLMDGAALVLTDSGGIQEETTALGVPCVTLREATERPVTIEHGTNRLAPWPLTADGILGSARAALAAGRRAPGSCAIEGWDGHAADRAVLALAAA